MDDPKAAPPSSTPRRRWLSILVYLLAALGLAALALFGYAYWQHKQEQKQPPARVTIDETAVIESVMTSNYGKYSANRKGWLYVDDNNRTYVMRVIQQAKVTDAADGDELYFLASGTGTIDDDVSVIYGVFHIRPTRPNDGGLTEVSQPVIQAFSAPIKPEHVHFEALSDKLWGWVVKVADGNAVPQERSFTRNVIWTARENEIAKLGEFIAAADHDPGVPCDEAKKAYDDWQVLAETDQGAAENIGPQRCEKQRWTYRTGTVNGNIPVPITVTAGGTLDGQPVEARKWKLMFDTKSFSYNVPEELQPW
jgi:hypothetical protein